MADLKEKHRLKFDAAKCACWAHSFHYGEHSSMNEPPDLPFFTGRKQSGSRCDGPGTSSSDSGSRSPTKHHNLHTECINQLSKWPMIAYCKVVQSPRINKCVYMFTADACHVHVTLSKFTNHVTSLH